jgi:acyl-[acyl-carrier-protein] desaturase
LEHPVTVSAERWTQTELLLELEQVVEANLNRHLSAAKEWFPHEYVPWSEGTTFDGVLDGQAWNPEQSRVSETARIALVLNLLTEDNLPSYHHEIATTFGREGAWGTWVHRWTAEEGRHGMAIRDYLLVTRAVDPIALERARMDHMSTGYQADHADSLLPALAYVSFQELATRISHRNTGRFTADPLCDQLLARIALDENLHMVFYRNLLGAALELAPDETMCAIADVATSFQMPGRDLPDFGRKSMAIANAGIYDPRIHHDEVLQPVLRHWNVFELEGLGSDGEQARERLAAYLAKLDRAAARFTQRREAAQATAAAGA